MKEIPIEMYCPLDFKNRIVYCFKIGEDHVVSNGCEFLHKCKECDNCCKKSIPLARAKLSRIFPEFSFHKGK